MASSVDFYAARCVVGCAPPTVSGTTLFWTCLLRCTSPYLLTRHSARLQTLVLEGDNKYDCTVCKTKTCATKRLTLHSTPRVLQLHLKRFGIFEEGGSAKIGHHVTFPELLNVQPFTSPEGQYSEISLDFALYAVVVHVGASIRRGHYVAYAKDPRGEWFQMDDHKASPVSLSEVLQVQAYMLFYI